MTVNLGQKGAGNFGLNCDYFGQNCDTRTRALKSRLIMGHPKGAPYAPPFGWCINACPKGMHMGTLRVPIGAGNEPKASGRATSKREKINRDL